MKKAFKTVWRKAKNKRVLTSYDEKTDTFLIQIKRLIEPGEKCISAEHKDLPVTVEIISNKIVITTFRLSSEAAEMLFLNLAYFINNNHD